MQLGPSNAAQFCNIELLTSSLHGPTVPASLRKKERGIHLPFAASADFSSWARMFAFWESIGTEGFMVVRDFEKLRIGLYLSDFDMGLRSG